ncbi:hypothetical protein DSO57_1034861 [Entomophthora muscae]|uniref:Uncharacterized protein n=1 Tax=Entomophthora muscae TaxID=34485 RepID=A0ACC2TAQ7_9FUNG|nr:hypothetical protein DSO57_1034861 [Entomophthora muscae]
MNLWFNQSTSRGSVSHTTQPQETTDQLPKFYCPPGAPFGPVNFTEYPLNPVYLEFTIEEILIYGPEARTRETETIYRECTKITIPPLLFRNKYNYLPAYLVPMTLPLTPRPNHPQESVVANESTFTQIFGVMYITLTILIDYMLAPILWWALPAGPLGCLPASSQETPTGWITDSATQHCQDIKSTVELQKVREESKQVLTWPTR